MAPSSIPLIEVSLDMSGYKLDRTAFKAQTADEAVKRQAEYSWSLTWQERLRIANYLNSVAYNYPEDTPPKLDRTAFKARGRE